MTIVPYLLANANDSLVRNIGRRFRITPDQPDVDKVRQQLMLAVAEAIPGQASFNATSSIDLAPHAFGLLCSGVAPALKAPARYVELPIQGVRHKTVSQQLLPEGRGELPIHRILATVEPYGKWLAFDGKRLEAERRFIEEHIGPAASVTHVVHDIIVYVHTLEAGIEPIPWHDPKDRFWHNPDGTPRRVVVMAT